MVRLRDIPRSATFAWSTGTQTPSIVTGTRAGALDAEFSSDSTLELWALDLDHASTSTDPSPIVSVVTEAKFHDIAWSSPSATYASGVIAGALDNGALQLWDAAKLTKTPDQSLIAKTTSHTGAIKAVRFNRADNNIVATAGVQGELYLTDLKNPSQPTRLGTNMARADDIECLDWNHKPANIFATGSTGGAIVVWDTKAKDKKDMLTIANVGRKPVSAVCWDPNVSTRLISATSSDQDPAINIWDLRKAAEPERTLRGHELGILSLAWCTHDSNLLLSCGKDNRNICWNPNTGTAYGDYSVATNWAFTTRWCPSNPDIFATAAFDGNISIQTLQNANQSDKPVELPADGEDFFSQTRQVPRQPTFSLREAPAWKKTRCGASFGFGGKLVYFRPEKGAARSRVYIDDFHVDGGIITKIKGFEEAIASGKISDICQDKIKATNSDDEKADWEIIQNLEHSKVRDTVRQHLGYAVNKTELPTSDDKPTSDSIADDDDDFAALIAASKNTTTAEPFHIHAKNESDQDKSITSALVTGDFLKAMEICIEADRMSDAFMIATCGGQVCIDKVQRAYLDKHAQSNSCARLLSAVSKHDLRDVVDHADVDDWKDIMVTLCSFATDAEFPDLCESLGDRLQAAGAPRTDSSLCYLVGSKLPKVVKTWIEMLQEAEARDLANGQDETSYAIYARSLQDFIEKVTVFRKVTGFQDRGSNNDAWPLADLYDKYTEFGDVLASHGQMDLAAKYYNLLPADYPTASVVQQRVKATQKPTAKPAAKPARAAATTMPLFTPAQAPVPTATMPASRAYAPSGYQPSPAGFNPAQTPMYGQMQTPSYGAPQPSAPSNNVMAPPPPPPQRMPGEGAPKPGNTVNWNDAPDNFFNKVAPPRRNTPGPLTPNIYSAPISKPVALPPPPKVGQMSKPGTPVSAAAIERPPSAMSTTTYTPVSASQAPGPNGFSSQITPQTSAPARNPYAPPPPAANTSSYAPSAPQPMSNAYGQPFPAATPPTSSGPAPPPSGRYAPPANYQAPNMASSMAPPSGYAPQGAQLPGRPNGAAQPMGTPAGPGSMYSRPVEQPPQPLAPPPRAIAKPTPPEAPRPTGELSGDAKFIKDVLTTQMDKVRATAPPQFQDKVIDMQKRLEILYQHLLANDLLKQDTLAQMRQVCQHIQMQDWHSAQPIFEAMVRDKQQTEGSQWMIGVKRLIKLNAAATAT